MNSQNPENPPFVFHWSLNKCNYTESIFTRKKMIEYTDIKRIYGFIKNNLGITFQGDKKYDFTSFKDTTEQEQIERYKNLYNPKLKGFQTAIYQPKHKWGRVIPANDYLSMAIMRRETRHSLCDGFYIDIDMVNAQPSIVYEISKMNGKAEDLVMLPKYIKKPTKYRTLIMNHHNCNKDCAKNLPITIMMGGTYKGWLREWDIQTNDNNQLPEMIKLEKELKDILEIVYAHNQHIKKDVLKQDPNKWRNEEESKRGVMGLWCQSVERLLQEAVIKYLVESKNFEIEKIVPCQDGFMILKELWYEHIIEDCNNIIKTQFNMDIKFINKPFDEKIEIPLFEENKPVEIWEDLLSSKKLADRFLLDYNQFIVKYKSNVYIYYNDRWYDETDPKKQHKFTVLISENIYNSLCSDISDDISLTPKEKIFLKKLLRTNTSTSYKMADIIKHILSKATEIEKDFNSNPFLLGFNNGVYDLVNNEFRNYKYDDYITMTTRYDYIKPDYSNPENQKIKDEINQIFETIHPDPEHLLLYKQILASGLDGRPYQKLFLFNGQGGNGKGLTGSLMDITLGDYYHQPSNGILKDVEKANTPSPDMINLKNKRYINFKEVAGAVKVAMLRNLTGGGKFCGRFLNQNPETFFMSGTFIMEFNTSPDLDGKPQRADYRRLVDIYFPINFTDDPTKINKEIGGVLYKQSNSYYETQEFLQKVKLIFLDILLEIYKTYRDTETNTGIKFTVPESIRLRTEQFIENQNLFQKVFNSNWEKVDIIPNDTEDKINKTYALKEIWTSITMSEEYKTLTYREKRQYGRDEFYKWIEGMFNISGNSKTGKIIVGIQPRTDLGGDIDDDDIINNGINPLDVL